MRAVVFANGMLSDPATTRRLLAADDCIVAADGGAHHCLQLGLTPAVVIGDLDSLDADDLETLRAAGCEFVRHPTAKDQTDLELALRHAHSHGATEILVFGAFGLRWDQTLANLLLPAQAEMSGVPIRLIDGHQEASVVRGGETYSFRGEPGDIVSLLPLVGDCHGMVTRGLEYPLAGDTLPFGSTRGVSNLLQGTEGSVHLQQGVLACIVIHAARHTNQGGAQ